MRQSTYLIGIVLLGLSIIIAAFIVNNTASNTTNIDEGTEIATSSIPDLMTMTQLAEYLQISEQSIDIIISHDDWQREGLSSYDTYQFIPYLLLDNQKRFIKTEIDAWLKYRNDNKLNYD
ncbi:Clp protease ClpB [Solibacillus sp. NPDC093137]|uniref:Clp protease ClpB n=1 Tax=Solibacillus sp. NPDC093137 TaxID=3390678 RepID=UPI003D07C4D1